MIQSYSKHLDPVWSPLALAADALKGPVGFRSYWLPESGDPRAMEKEMISLSISVRMDILW